MKKQKIAFHQIQKLLPWISNSSQEEIQIGIVKRWLEEHKKFWSRSYLLQLWGRYLDWFYETPTTAVISTFLLVFIAIVLYIDQEKIKSRDETVFSILLERTEALAVLTAVTFYFKEARDRKKISTMKPGE